MSKLFESKSDRYLFSSLLATIFLMMIFAFGIFAMPAEKIAFADPETYTITYKEISVDEETGAFYETDYSGSEIPEGSFTYTAGQNTVLPVPEKTGHTFKGWFDGCDPTVAEKITAISEETTGDVVLYAYWEKDVYQVSFYSEDGKAKLYATTVSYGETAVYRNALPTKADDSEKYHYAFDAWCATQGGNVPFDLSDVTENVSLYPIFKRVPNTFTITLNSCGGTGFADMTYNYGDTLRLPTNATKEYYAFLGWTLTQDENDTDYITKIRSTDYGDKTFYAKWTPNIIDVSIADIQIEYDGKDHSVFVYGLKPEDTVLYKQSGEYTSKNFVFHNVTVNDEKVTVKVSRRNYFDYEKTVSVKILPRSVKVVADRKTTVKGEDTDELTYHIDGRGLCTGDKFTGNISCDVDKNIAGEYDIKVGTLSAGKNYELEFVEAEYTVKDTVLQMSNITDENAVAATITQENGFSPSVKFIIYTEEHSDVTLPVPSNKTVLASFYATLYVGNGEIDPDGSVTVTFKAPDDLEEAEEYEILAVENGKTIIKKGTLSNGYISFESTELGHFAIVKTTKETTVFDMKMIIYILLGVIALEFLLIVLLDIKCRKDERKYGIRGYAVVALPFLSGITFDMMQFALTVALLVISLFMLLIIIKKIIYLGKLKHY